MTLSVAVQTTDTLHYIQKHCFPFETACSLARQEAFFSIFKKVVFLSHSSMNLTSDAIFDTHTFKPYLAAHHGYTGLFACYKEFSSP